MLTFFHKNLTSEAYPQWPLRRFYCTDFSLNIPFQIFNFKKKKKSIISDSPTSQGLNTILLHQPHFGIEFTRGSQRLSHKRSMKIEKHPFVEKWISEINGRKIASLLVTHPSTTVSFTCNKNSSKRKLWMCMKNHKICSPTCSSVELQITHVEHNFRK